MFRRANCVGDESQLTNHKGLLGHLPLRSLYVKKGISAVITATLVGVAPAFVECTQPPRRPGCFISSEKFHRLPPRDLFVVSYPTELYAHRRRSKPCQHRERRRLRSEINKAITENFLVVNSNTNRRDDERHQSRTMSEDDLLLKYESLKQQCHEEKVQNEDRLQNLEKMFLAKGALRKPENATSSTHRPTNIYPRLDRAQLTVDYNTLRKPLTPTAPPLESVKDSNNSGNAVYYQPL